MRYITSDLAKLMDVSTNTIRRYEKSGFLHPKRDVSNYRWYESYDVSKVAMIRLYIKCGFSHEQIRAMLGSSSQDMLEICTNRLEELDKQMERLKRLRHWLKDNIQLVNTVNGMDEGFVLMENPALWYVISDIGDEILKENGRLDTIKTFMYDAPEVQYITLFRREDIKLKRFVPYNGLAIKEMDIEKFGMNSYIENNRYIEYYPGRLCLYGTIDIPHRDMYDNKIVDRYRLEYINRSGEYMAENSLKPCGDVMLILANAVSDIVSMLACTPVSKI